MRQNEGSSSLMSALRGLWRLHLLSCSRTLNRPEDLWLDSQPNVEAQDEIGAMM